jgi:hypothetical protein
MNNGQKWRKTAFLGKKFNFLCVLCSKEVLTIKEDAPLTPEIQLDFF